MAELAILSGEAREKQQARVNELVQIAARLNDRPPRQQKEAGEEEGVYSIKPAEHRSHGQASSPHVHRDRAPSVNSGRDKRVPGYDRAAAGKQRAQDSEQPKQPQHSRSRAREQRQYSHHESGRGGSRMSVDRYNDGDTAMEAAGYRPKRAPRAPEGALGGRVGHQVLEEGDARLKLDRI
jgi:hypothetical protein